MANQKKSLPKFKDPPVIETVLDVHFALLEQFSIPHFGLYWDKIRDKYPVISVHPPLSIVTDQSVLEKKSLGQPKVKFISGDHVRCWFIDKEQNHLIQVQKDRFIFNWRKVTGTELYPSFDKFKPKFKTEWTKFCSFLDSEGIPTPQVKQCEVTYVNHFEIGRETNSFGEIAKVMNLWKSQKSDSFLPNPDIVRFNTSFSFPDKKGKLHISLEPTLRGRDAKEIIQLRLIARGQPQSSNLEDILAWFEIGHEWIVKGFTDLTTSEMHKLWGRIQ